MEGHCSTVESPQWAVVPSEEEEDILKLLPESWTISVDVNSLVNAYLGRI